MSLWRNSEIEDILIQLQEMWLPFQAYEFAVEDGELCLLGRSANSCVYRIVSRYDASVSCAVKVIGFGDRCVRSDDFYSSVLFQMEAGKEQDTVLRADGIVELSVRVEGDHRVTKAEVVPLGEGEPEEGALYLQFILMEEAAPVLTSVKTGSPVLFPKRLARFEEEEILHLACDIASALEAAHKKKLLHRDVKLENIFYSSQGDHYKLGDFGIARVMENGMASTTAFTKGYGAPEVVGTLEDEYDCTADVYSLGIVLYVLLNGLRFPGSRNYHPNAAQYRSGFLPEPPAGGSEAFREVVLKMIRFDPDERYQSMGEVRNALEGLRYGKRVQFQLEHKQASLTLGLLFGAGGLLLKAGQFAENRFGWNLTLPDDFAWMYGLLMSLSVVLLYHRLLLWQKDMEITRYWLQKNSYWLLTAIAYAVVAIFGIKLRNILPTGLCGMAFCAVWVCRENLLLWIDRHKKSPDA